MQIFFNATPPPGPGRHSESTRKQLRQGEDSPAHYPIHTTQN